jgi:hypothetical protein
MSSKLHSQSAVNWRAIKKLYLQGCRRSYSPQPNHPTSNSSPKIDFASIEKLIRPVIEEMDQLYRQKLQKMEFQTQQLLSDLNNRILGLQEELKSIKTLRQERHPLSNSQGRNSLLIDPILIEEGSDKEKSIIHIEEEEESLLDGVTAEKYPYETSTVSELATTNKKLKSSSNCRKLFLNGDSTEQLMRYQYSEGRYPASTKESTFFEYSPRELKDELNTLRSHIEQIHNIKLEDSDIAPALSQLQVAPIVKTVEVAGSKNEVKHVKNENIELRNLNSRLRDQLERSEQKLKEVKALLMRGLEVEEARQADQ